MYVVSSGRVIPRANDDSYRAWGLMGKNGLLIPWDSTYICAILSRQFPFTTIKLSTKLFLSLDDFTPFCSFARYFGRISARSVWKILLLLSHYVRCVCKNSYYSFSAAFVNFLTFFLSFCLSENISTFRFRFSNLKRNICNINVHVNMKRETNRNVECTAAKICIYI